MPDDDGGPPIPSMAPSPPPRRDPPRGARVRLCDATELAEKGRAFVFDVRHFHEPARAFALRVDGRVVAYLNRCVHVPTELDWTPGEFLDAEREFIICSIHGAVYRPHDGRCAGGPCGRGRLTPLIVEEDGGDIWWQPTHDTRAPFED